MAEKFTQEATAAEKLDSFLTRNRTTVLTVALVLIVALVVALAAVVINGKTTEKGLAQVDEVYYALVTNADSLTGDALSTRQNDALNRLSALAGKGGIVGVRANMLAADVYYQKEDYAQAQVAWERAAEAKKTAYTAPLAYFNAAAAAENANDLESAVADYKKAADSKDFLLAAHALFSLGRVHETKGDYAAAQEAYNTLNDIAPDTDFASLAKTRLIALKTAGNID